MNARLILLAASMLLAVVGCRKDTPVEETADLDLSGIWDVYEYGKYRPDEPPVYTLGIPYWHINRYSQGLEIEEDRFFFRYGTDNEPNATDTTTHFPIRILENTIEFEVDNEVIEAEIVEANPQLLWIKYQDNTHVLEYKYERN